MEYISRGMAFFGIVDVCVLMVLRKQYYDTILENKILKIQIQEERNNYRKINEIYEECRIMRHDLKHYLVIILNLIMCGECKKAEALIVDLVGRRTSAPMIYYQSSNVINAVLNDKQAVCRTAGIDICFAISGKAPTRHEVDIAVILANLLDNAIAAQDLLDDGKIWLEMYQQKGMYYIIVKNKVSKSVLASNPKLMTTRSDKNGHGFGVISIESRVRRMDGCYCKYEEGNVFVSYIVIPF